MKLKGFPFISLCILTLTGCTNSCGARSSTPPADEATADGGVAQETLSSTPGDATNPANGATPNNAAPKPRAASPGEPP